MPVNAPGYRRLRWFVTVLFASGSLAFAQGHAWKFFLFSDTRGPASTIPINTNILSEMARAVVREKPAFVLFGGDYAYYTFFPELQQWTNLMSPVYEAGIPL